MVFEKEFLIFVSKFGDRPRECFDLKDVTLIEKCVSLKGIFEDPKNSTIKFMNPVRGGKYTSESKIPRTNVVQIKLKNQHTIYLKMEISEVEFKSLLQKLDKAVADCKEHIKAQEAHAKPEELQLDVPILRASSNNTISVRNVSNRTDPFTSSRGRESAFHEIFSYPVSYVESDVGGKRDNEDAFSNFDSYPEDAIPTSKSTQYSLYGL